MRYQDLNTSLKSHITTLRAVTGVLVLINLLLWRGWNNAKSDLIIHIPPDIRSGASLKPGDISPANVYAFAGYIFQQLNRWDKNGADDYGKQISYLSAFLTPQYLEYLKNDLEIRGQKGELAGRTRAIQPIPGQGFEERRVDILDANTWVVWLDFHIQEFVRGMEVKNIKIRYPIRVVRFNVDPEKNPWGLALDGFQPPGPAKLGESDLNPDETTSDTATIPSTE